MKQCIKCKESKSINNFNKLGRAKDGRQPWCRDCTKRYYRNTAERQKNRYAEWYANPDNVEKRLKTRRAYRNSEHGRTKIKSLKAARRAIERGAVIEDPRVKYAYLVLYSYYGEMCMHPDCEAIKNIHLDHIIPLSVGGMHSYDNFQLLCIFHNTSKGNRSAADYRPVEITHADIEELI